MTDPYALEDGSHISVVGGGPTGTFFSIFALKMSKMVGKKIQLTIFEQKDFTKDGPLGCNRCGGIISELLVQMLAVEGINLPDTVIQRGIDSYKLYTNNGHVYIGTPAHEKTIATVYRGGGPKGIIGKEKESFDKYLLKLAIKEGAVHCPIKIDRIEYRNKRPRLFCKDQMVQESDLVVGAIGVKSQTSQLFEELGFGYKRPETVTAAIAEIGMEKQMISEYFGNSVQLFLLPIKDIKFAAMIPKGTYVTVCILGTNLTQKTVNEFLEHGVVQAVLPNKEAYTIDCRCLPKMNVKAPKIPFTDRVVICGDAGSTRLFKDGLGAAYLMGKAAAKTAIFDGVSKKHFQGGYYPVYKSIIIDNWFGKLLFSGTDLLKYNKAMTKSMLEVVQNEQSKNNQPRVLSSVLWDMFTGNERYKNIFRNAINFPMFYDLLKCFVKI
jgi:flavin-dependent dehydrogenase